MRTLTKALAVLAIGIVSCATPDTWFLDTSIDWGLDTAADSSLDMATDTHLQDGLDDTAIDVPEDTIADTLPDTLADTIMDTPADTAADTLADTAFDTWPDTVADTWLDTVTDTAPDTTDATTDIVPTGNILVLVEVCETGQDSITPAIAGLGLTSVTTFTYDDASLYGQLLSGSWDLVIVDEYYSYLETITMDVLVAYIDAGGSVILSYWDMYWSFSTHAFLDRAGVTLTGEYTYPLPVYGWIDDPMFTTPNAVSDLASVVDICISDGQYGAATTGTQIAGYTSADAYGQAAIVLGPTGRVIFNMFTPQVVYQDADVDGVQDMVELYQNQISLLY